jgi:GNAT superfamily N-acetyltransferase
MEYIQVAMIRPTLDRLPRHDLPAGYAIRPWQKGDRATWVRIWKASDQFETYSPQKFDKEFGRDEKTLRRRMLFLIDPTGRPCGTTTAWHEPNYRGKPWGRIHWVAITPEHRGKGLSKPMMVACMQQMKAIGHVRAILGTQTVRIPAINLYLSLGFIPEMHFKDARRAWSLVAEKLDHPAIRKALKAQP